MTAKRLIWEVRILSLIVIIILTFGVLTANFYILMAIGMWTLVKALTFGHAVWCRSDELMELMDGTPGTKTSE